MYKPEQTISSEIYDRLIQSVLEYGVRVTWIKRNENSFGAMTSLIGKAQQMTFEIEAAFKELVRGFRFSPQECELKRDGLDVRTLELSAYQQFGLELVCKSPAVHRILSLFGMNRIAAKDAAQHVHSSQAVMLLWVLNHSPMDYVKAGHALDRLWLELTRLSICLQPMTSLAVLLRTPDQPSAKLLTEKELQRVGQLKEEFLKLVNVTPGQHLAFIARIGYADPPSVRSVRRQTNSFIS